MWRIIASMSTWPQEVRLVLDYEMTTEHAACKALDCYCSNRPYNTT